MAEGGGVGMKIIIGKRLPEIRTNVRLEKKASLLIPADRI
jgi:hypothetical protein